MSGRCRFVLFLMVGSVHQVSVIQRMLKQLLSLKISKRLSKFFGELLIYTWIILKVSEILFQKENFQYHLGKDKNIRSSV